VSISLCFLFDSAEKRGDKSVTMSAERFLSTINSAGEPVSRIVRELPPFLQVTQNQLRLSVKRVNGVSFCPNVGMIWDDFLG
jgi:hypothetical protein